MVKTNFPTQIVYPQPFASGTGAACATFGNTSDANNPNFVDGFPSIFSTNGNIGDTFKFVTRGMFNGIGRLATQNDYYRMCGGVNTFNPDFATLIGGYAEGAVLQYLKGNTLYYVISNVDGNMIDFRSSGPDGVNWSYCYESEEGSSETKTTLIYEKSLSGVPVNNNYANLLYVFKSPKDGFIIIDTDIKANVNSTIENGSIITKPFYGGCIFGVNLGTTLPPDIFMPSSTTSEQNMIATGSGATAKTWENIYSTWNPYTTYTVTSQSSPPNSFPNGAVKASTNDYIAISIMAAKYSWWGSPTTTPSGGDISLGIQEINWAGTYIRILM